MMALSLATSVVLTRALQPEGRGLYAIVIFFVSILTYYSTFGIGQAAIYFIGKADTPPSVIVGNTLVLAAILSLASMTLGVTLILFFSGRFFPEVPSRFLWIGIVLIPVQLLMGIMTQLVLAVQNVRIYNFARLFQSAVTLFVMVVLLWWRSGTAITAVGIEIGVSAFVCLLLWAALRKDVGPLVYQVKIPYVRKAFKYGFSTYLGSTLLLFHYRVDIFLINLFMKVSQVGFYSLSASLAEKITFFSDSISTLLFPRLASEKNVETANSLTPLVFRTVLLAMMGMGGLLIGLGGVLITSLYGHTYGPSILPLRILVIGTIAAAAWGVLESDFKSRGFPLLGFLTTLISAVLNVVLNCFWIPRYGIVGAAMATAVSYTLSLSLGFGIFCHLSGQKTWAVLLPQKRDFLLYRDVLGRLFQRSQA